MPTLRNESALVLETALKLRRETVRSKRRLDTEDNIVHATFLLGRKYAPVVVNTRAKVRVKIRVKAMA